MIRSGISGWKLSSFYPDSLYNRIIPLPFMPRLSNWVCRHYAKDHFFKRMTKVLHMLLRVTGKGWKGHLWLTESKDNGKSWSRPVEAPFSDNDSKFHFGRLPDKRFYYVGIPDTLHHYDRNPLVLSLSKRR
jgi:hypothetical protein